MRKIKRHFAIIAVVATASMSLPPTAIADNVSDAEEAAEAAKMEYDLAVDTYERAVDLLSEKDAQVASMEGFLASERNETGRSAKFLYRQSKNQLSELIEIFVSEDNFADALEQASNLRMIYEKHTETFKRYSDDLSRLSAEREELAAAAADAETAKNEMSEALDTALEAYDAATAMKKTQDVGSSSSYPESHDVSPGVIGDVPSEITMTVDQLLFSGVVYANGYRYTFYQEHVLPGGGLNIPGRAHDSGMVVDGDGYICVASSDLPKGTVVPTPLGRAGKVYDSGCASGTIDLYLV